MIALLNAPCEGFLCVVLVSASLHVLLRMKSARSLLHTAVMLLIVCTQICVHSCCTQFSLAATTTMQQLLLSLSPCRVGHRVCSSIHVRLQHASPVHRSTRLRCTAADAGDSSEEQRITSRTKGVSAEDRVISNADALLLSLEGTQLGC